MRLFKAAFIAILGAVVAVPLPAVAGDAGSPPLDLYAFFLGHAHGEGRFVSGLTGTDRRFTVEAHGRLEGGDLLLVESIAYDDGVKDTAVWRFTRSGTGYTGRRTGVETLVPVAVSNGRVTMSYVAATPGTDGKLVKLRFADALELQDQHTLLNTAKVSWLGIPVGTVEVTFRRN